MDSVTRGFDPDPQKPTPKPPSFPNGTLKKHLPRPPAPAAEEDHHHHHYRECLRNHAASLGGHAVDGCCEFMPSPSADPAVPTSITCAACGCHRNFHRRLPLDPRLLHDDTDADDDEEESENGEHCLRRRRRCRRSSASPPHYSSAPHMLLALSGAGTGGPGSTQTMAAPITVSSGAFQAVALPHAEVAAAGAMPRKRFRTKFSAEQKERMQEMSERLGWRLQKKDDAVVEEFCRQVGVERGVFKVWMHNNKHTYHGSPSSRRKELVGSGGGAEGNGLGGSGGGGGDDDYRGGNNDVVNGSPPAS